MQTQLLSGHRRWAGMWPATLPGLVAPVFLREETGQMGKPQLKGRPQGASQSQDALCGAECRLWPDVGWYHLISTKNYLLNIIMLFWLY